jgi:hypothetical protein
MRMGGLTGETAVVGLLQVVAGAGVQAAVDAADAGTQTPPPEPPTQAVSGRGGRRGGRRIDSL